MHVERCAVEAIWEEYVERFSRVESVFLQSWAWGVAQERVGNRVERLVITDTHGVAAIMLCVAQDLFGGRRVILAPRGPLCRKDVRYEDIVNAVMKSGVFQDFARRVRAIALRIEPDDNQGVLPWLRIKDVEPANTWMIPMRGYTEEGLWNALKQKTRYNIRLAHKHGVIVERATHEYALDRIFDIWDTLSHHTAERHGIGQHQAQYTRNIFQTLLERDMLEVYVAYYRGAAVAINIGVRYGNAMTYLYGASDHAHRAIKAPNALQWEFIRLAFLNGAQWYDFYGIAPEGAEDHKLAGVTRFKQSFVGESRIYAGTYEVPLDRVWYAIYQWIRTLRTYLRR